MSASASASAKRGRVSEDAEDAPPVLGKVSRRAEASDGARASAAAASRDPGGGGGSGDSNDVESDSEEEVVLSPDEEEDDEDDGDSAPKPKDMRIVSGGTFLPPLCVFPTSANAASEPRARCVADLAAS